MVVKGTVLEQINIFIAQNDGNDEIYKMAISVFQNFDFSKKYFWKSKIFENFWIIFRIFKIFKKPKYIC